MASSCLRAHTACPTLRAALPTKEDAKLLLQIPAHRHRVPGASPCWAPSQPHWFPSCGSCSALTTSPRPPHSSLFAHPSHPLSLLLHALWHHAVPPSSPTILKSQQGQEEANPLFSTMHRTRSASKGVEVRWKRICVCSYLCLHAAPNHPNIHPSLPVQRPTQSSCIGFNVCGKTEQSAMRKAFMGGFASSASGKS